MKHEEQEVAGLLTGHGEQKSTGPPTRHKEQETAGPLMKDLVGLNIIDSQSS